MHYIAALENISFYKECSRYFMCWLTCNIFYDIQNSACINNSVDNISSSVSVSVIHSVLFIERSLKTTGLNLFLNDVHVSYCRYSKQNISCQRSIRNMSPVRLVNKVVHLLISIWLWVVIFKNFVFVFTSSDTRGKWKLSADSWCPHRTRRHSLPTRIVLDYMLPDRISWINQQTLW